MKTGKPEMACPSLCERRPTGSDEFLSQALELSISPSITHEAHIQVHGRQLSQGTAHCVVDPLCLIAEGPAAKLGKKEDLRGEAMRVDNGSLEGRWSDAAF
jgi:hypothetical protein